MIPGLGFNRKRTETVIRWVGGPAWKGVLVWQSVTYTWTESDTEASSRKHYFTETAWKGQIIKDETDRNN
jgi:hypothetical protein